MTRKEYVEWARARALAYLDAPRLIPNVAPSALAHAVSSMVSDLSKRPEYAGDPLSPMMFAMGTSLAMMGDVAGVRDWIEGF